MNKFLLKIFFAVLPFGLLPLVLYKMGINPLLSNNVSLDAKVQWLQKEKIMAVDLLLSGSSLTQCNFDSDIIDSATEQTFVNAAAWGLSMVDQLNLLPVLIDKYHPNKILITTGVPDFVLRDKNIFYACDVKNYLDNIPYGWYNLKYFSIRNQNERKQLIESYSADSSHLYTLAYDTHGAISFKKKYFQGDTLRFSRRFSYPKNIAYDALNKICLLAKGNNIRLIVADAPVRNDFANTPGEKYALKTHRKKVKSIVNKNGFVFIEADENKLSDSHFVDQVHLNNEGAGVYTKAVLQKIKL